MYYVIYKCIVVTLAHAIWLIELFPRAATDVPTKYNMSLAEWAQRHRRECRNSCLTMTTTRIAHLEAISNWSWERVRTTSTASTSTTASSSATASTIAMRDDVMIMMNSNDSDSSSNVNGGRFVLVRVRCRTHFHLKRIAFPRAFQQTSPPCLSYMYHSSTLQTCKWNGCCQTDEEKWKSSIPLVPLSTKEGAWRISSRGSL